MTSHAKKRTSAPPEQSPTPSLSQHLQQQHRRTPSGGNSNSPHPTSRHDYHYYRHSSRRSNGSYHHSEEEDEEGMTHITPKSTGTSTSSHSGMTTTTTKPPAVLVSPPPLSPSVPPHPMTNRRAGTNDTTTQHSRRPINRSNNNNTNTKMDDDGTKALISQLVATDMARQDYKEKVVAVNASTVSPLGAAGLSPHSARVVMKQRPPPPHRSNSSSQHSHRSSTQHSTTTSTSTATNQSIHSSSHGGWNSGSSAHHHHHRQSHLSPSPPAFSTVSPTASIKDINLAATRSPSTTTNTSTASWNETTTVLRTPSPQRNRVVVSKASAHQPLGLYHAPDLFVVSPSKSPHVGPSHHGPSKLHYPQASPKKRDVPAVTSSPSSPREISPSFGRLGIAAMNVVTPPSPYRPPPPLPKERSANSITPGIATSNARDMHSKTSAADRALQEAKRREREQGPTLMSSSMRAPMKKAPPSTSTAMGTSDDSNQKRQARIERHAAIQAMDEYRKANEPSNSSSHASVPATAATLPRSKENKSTGGSNKNAADESLAEAKRRERNRGPALASSSTSSTASGSVVPRVSRRDASFHNVSTKPSTDVPSNTTTALGVARDDLAKRRERERGPSLFSAISTPRQRQSLQTAASRQTAASSKKSAPNLRDGNMGTSLSMNDVDIGALKRRERDSGPALASATGSNPQVVATSRRRTSTVPAPASGNDPMGDMKRQERERNSGRLSTRTPAFVRNTPPRSTNSDASSSPPSKPSKSYKNDSRVVFDVDGDEGSTDDTAYALAMARTNLERKMLQENGPFRDDQMESTGSPSAHAANRGHETHPGAASVVGRERNAKVEDEDHGPSLAPAIGRAPQRISPRSPVRESVSSNIWSNFDIEAQAGVPLVTPGAFAVHGVSSRESDYTSSEDSDDDYHSVTDNGLDDGDGTFTPDTPLEAEVYDQVILDGAVVTATDEEEEMVDPKVLKRLRCYQISILAFALCAIGVIIGSILGFQSNDKLTGPPTVQGWNQSGVDIFGPTEEPQTLFGSAVAISGDGTRIAVAAPGTDMETTLDVGEVYILEAEQKKNGTNWKILDVLVGPGPSNAVQTSIAMTTDSKWLAIGYARHANGSHVQMYQEVDGLWKPASSPIMDKNGTDTAWFGYALDISDDGTIVAIGAPQMNSPNEDGSGGVHIFQQSSSNGDWIQMGSVIFGMMANEFLGWTVAISTSNGRIRIAAGSPVSNDTTGVVRVYDWDDTEWLQVGTDLIGDVPLNRFGESVAMSEDGSILAVGVRGSAFEIGQAKIYRDINGGWELDDMSFLGTEPGDGFGASVALSGDGNVLAIGGPQNTLFGDRAGIISIYKYDPSNSLWKQSGSSIGSSSVTEFGMSIALSNDGQRVVGGAPTTTYDGSVARAGSVLVFDADETQ